MKHSLGVSAIAVTILLSAGVSHAAGFQLNEYSAAGMGRSFAGAGVVGDDFSSIGYNPAGMSLNKTNGAQVGGSAVSLKFDFKGNNGVDTTTYYDSTRITRVMPSGFAQHKLNDKATVGLGVYVPFGLATDYENGWFAENHGGLSQLTNLNVSPSFSYQLHDMLSVGVALNLQHAKARITGTTNGVSQDLQGDDWGAGYSIGLTLKPMKNMRFGVSYRSKVSHELKGKIKMSGYPAALDNVYHLNGNYDASAKLTTPETVLFAGSYDVTNRLTLSGSARWTRWSRFQNLDVVARETFKTYVPGIGLVARPAGSYVSATYENWKNTWFYALGADYKINRSLTMRVGGAYDDTVIKSSKYRTVRIPDGRRIWASLGASYTYENIQFDVGYAHLFGCGGYARGRDSLSLSQRPNIKYSLSAEMFSLGLQYKF